MVAVSRWDRRNRKTGGARLLGAMAATAILALSGCAPTPLIEQDPKAQDFGTIKISAGVSQETQVVAYIYAAVLQQAGYHTEVIDTGGNRAGYLEKMKDPQGPQDNSAATPTPTPEPTHADKANPATVDLTPDYSGNLLFYLTDDGAFSTSYIEQQRSASATPTPTATAEITADMPTPSVTPTPEETALNSNGMNSNDVLDSVDRLLPDELGLLSASAAQNKDQLAVTAATAARYNLSSLNDLAQHCKDLTFGVPQDFRDKPYGMRAIAEYYRCQPKNIIVLENHQDLSRALAADEVQVADISSGSEAIDRNSYKVLDDPSGVFIAQQIVPVMRSYELPSSAQNAVNTVSTQIGTDDLKTFERLTHGTGAMKPEDVATFWLEHTKE